MERYTWGALTGQLKQVHSVDVSIAGSIHLALPSHVLDTYAVCDLHACISWAPYFVRKALRLGNSCNELNMS